MEKLPVVKEKERAILVGVSLKREPAYKINEYLDELEQLAKTAGAEVVARFVQRLETPDPATYIRKGKLKEIKKFIDENKIDVVIFEGNLKPAQHSKLEEILQVKVLDRTMLILDIFALHAKTDLAKAQVELAQYQYLLPRLKGMWTHLERQRGGIGLRGPGEKELETDRRRINERIVNLKRRLEEYEKQIEIRTKAREGFVKVALIGYTNVGKSTLMRVLAKEDVLVEDKLFATLDTKTRKVVIKNVPFLLSDTVGFIRRLPHRLIKAFHSTLYEVREADLLLHVIDISHPEFEEHIKVVNNTLKEIGAADKPMILVFNKIDKYTYEEKDPFDLTPKEKKNFTLEDWKNTYLAKGDYPAVFISAVEKIGIEELKELLYQEVKKIYKQKYPHSKKFIFDDEYLQYDDQIKQHPAAEDSQVPD